MNRETLVRILDLARWAPSGDNTQPWRFEIVSDGRVVVHGFDTRDWCVYDLDGRASQMAVGALLETLRLAATLFGIRADGRRWPDDGDESHLRFVLDLTDDPAIVPDPLAAAIETRCVHRRALSTRPLEPEQRNRLEHALPSGYSLRWFASPADRWRVARLMFANAKTRLTCREAFEVHKSVIDWTASFSKQRIPERALGVGPVTARLMRWAMKDWRRVEFLNRYLMGTWLPRLQLDLLPGWRCAAHFVIVAPAPPVTVDNALAAGRAMQRVWLAAGLSGLQLQPEMTPIIFSRYVRERRRFSASVRTMTMAQSSARRFDRLFGEQQASRIVFLARCGIGEPSVARSIRLSVDELAWRGQAPQW